MAEKKLGPSLKTKNVFRTSLKLENFRSEIFEADKTCPSFVVSRKSKHRPPPHLRPLLNKTKFNLRFFQNSRQLCASPKINGLPIFVKIFCSKTFVRMKHTFMIALKEDTQDES